MDDSGSIDESQWAQALLFTQSLVGSFPRVFFFFRDFLTNFIQIGDNDVRVAIVTFSDASTVQIGLSGNYSAVVTALLNIARYRISSINLLF